LGVLRFYGHQLNYEEVGLSVLGDGILFRKVRPRGRGERGRRRGGL